MPLPPRHPLRSRCIWLLPLLLALSGCVADLLQRPAGPANRTYLLQWHGADQSTAADRDGPSLAIAPVRAAAGFESAGMAYLRHPHQIEYFANHRWVDAPARMLEPLVVRAAESGGRLRSVASPGSGTRADLRLDITLLHLQQLYLVQPPQLQLAVRVQLVDIASARLLGSAVLSVDEPLAQQTPGAGVAAANRALAVLLPQLQGFLAAQLDRLRGTASGLR